MSEQEIRVSNRNSANFECFRFDNLNFFYGMSEPLTTALEIARAKDGDENLGDNKSAEC